MSLTYFLYVRGEHCVLLVLDQISDGRHLLQDDVVDDKLGLLEIVRVVERKSVGFPPKD